MFNRTDYRINPKYYELKKEGEIKKPGLFYKPGFFHSYIL